MVMAQCQSENLTVFFCHSQSCKIIAIYINQCTRGVTLCMPACYAIFSDCHCCEGEEMRECACHVCVSPQSAVGLLAMSIPALATTGDELHCHLSHPLASERCSQLLTALTGLQLQSLSSPEDVSSILSSEFFRGLGTQRLERNVISHEFMGFVRLGSCQSRLFQRN